MTSAALFAALSSLLVPRAVQSMKGELSPFLWNEPANSGHLTTLC